MGDALDINAVVTWPQAMVAVVLILAVLVWPTIAGWVQARRGAVAINQVRATLTTTNGGSHVRDSLDRIEGAQAVQGAQLADVVSRVTALERRRRWL